MHGFGCAADPTGHQSSAGDLEVTKYVRHLGKGKDRKLLLVDDHAVEANKAKDPAYVQIENLFGNRLFIKLWADDQQYLEYAVCNVPCLLGIPAHRDRAFWSIVTDFSFGPESAVTIPEWRRTAQK